MKMIVVVSVLTALSMTAHAAPKARTKKPVAKPAAAAPAASPSAASEAASKKKLSKDISFSGSQVEGKYLSAGESIAEVEGDKEMAGLIGIRKNFRDRLNSEVARLQAQTSQSSAPTSGKGL